MKIKKRFEGQRSKVKGQRSKVKGQRSNFQGQIFKVKVKVKVKVKSDTQPYPYTTTTMEKMTDVPLTENRKMGKKGKKLPHQTLCCNYNHRTRQDSAINIKSR